MSESRKKSEWLLYTMLAVVAPGILALAFGLYAWAYFAMSDLFTVELHGREWLHRGYRENWQASFFKPAAMIESRATGRTVKTFAIVPLPSPESP